MIKHYISALLGINFNVTNIEFQNNTMYQISTNNVTVLR